MPSILAVLANGLTLVQVLLAFTIIVFIHELGHYLVARWNGIAIQTFSIGFGPELLGFNDRSGTRWRLSAVPLGGYVRFVGDMNAASVPDEEFIARLGPELSAQLFVNKTVWQRIAVVAAGPIANVLLTFVVLYALLLGFGRYTVPAVIDHVGPWSPAMVAGLEPGDRILSVDGFDAHSFDDFQRLIQTAPERQVTIVLDRGGDTRTVSLVPEASIAVDRFGGRNRIGRIGVSKGIVRDEVIHIQPDPVSAVSMTLEEMRLIIDRTAAFLGDFFVGRGDVAQLGGPVKVAQVSWQVASFGVPALVTLMAYLSLNIGIFNLLPIPVLDGGHLLFYAAEAIRRRPLSRRAQEIGFRIGFAIIVSLMIFTFFNDTIFDYMRHTESASGTPSASPAPR